MKFYKLDKALLEKELNTDFIFGLSRDEVVKRSSECSNSNSSYDFFANKLNFKFGKSALFLLLSACVFVLSSIFNKDAYQLIFFITIIAIASLGAAVFYTYLFFLNKRINNDDRKNVFHDLTVIRDGEKTFLKNSEILYGDVVLLQKGDYIPFDACIIESESLLVDETDVTSRNIVEKHAGVISDDNVPVTELYNSVFSGSYVISGKAKVVVTDVGKRVYLSKSRKKKRLSNKYASKITDFSRLLLLILVIIAAVFTVICSLISKDYISPISLAFLFVSLLFTDFLSKYVLTLFANSFVTLSDDGIYLKNPSVIEKINSCDLVLWEQDIVFDGPASVTGFSDGKKYYSLSEISKNNFELFIYAALCSESNLSEAFKNSIVKILKKVNIDYAELKSFCPIVSSYSDVGTQFEMCGRVYDENNLIIAKGSLAKILEICSISINDIPKDIYDKLCENSTDIIAVAVKSVEVIPNDLAEEKNGFTFIGMLAVKKDISNDVISKLNLVGKRGFNSLILYAGNKISADIISKQTGFDSISYDELALITGKPFSGIHLVYDYTGKTDVILNKAVELGYRSICFKAENSNSKTITVDSFDLSSYQMKNCDVICKRKFDAAYQVLEKSDKTYLLINNFLENIVTFISVYILCGTLFSALNKQLLFTPMLLAFMTFLIFTVSAVYSFYCKKIPGICNTKKFSAEPIKFVNIINILIVSLYLVLFIVLFNFSFTPTVIIGMVTVALIAYIPNYQFKTEKAFSYLDVFCILPAIISSILFMSPLSAAFGVADFSWASMFISLAAGIGLRLLVNLFDKLLKK